MARSSCKPSNVSVRRDGLTSVSQDDASALDIPTMRQWNLVLRIFMAEYLHLRPNTLPSARESANSVRRSESELVSPH